MNDMLTHLIAARRTGTPLDATRYTLHTQEQAYALQEAFIPRCRWPASGPARPAPATGLSSSPTSKPRSPCARVARPARRTLLRVQAGDAVHVVFDGVGEASVQL